MKEEVLFCVGIRDGKLCAGVMDNILSVTPGTMPVQDITMGRLPMLGQDERQRIGSSQNCSILLRPRDTVRLGIRAVCQDEMVRGWMP